MQTTHINKIKIFHNVHYYFTCGYDVDHPGNICPVGDPEYNMPNILCDKSHMYANQGASMLAQHKSLLNGRGAGIGWILSNSISKAKFVIQCHQEFVRLHQQQQPCHPQNTHHKQYCVWGRNTQQHQPQFGANLYHHHQGWL